MSNDLMTRIRTQLLESAAVKQQTAELCAQDIARAASVVADTFRRGGKMLLCGNGGSAADAQHIAGELVAKLARERPALAAIALTVNSSLLTALVNDGDPECVFARQVEALGQRGDVLFAISTSGNSANVNQAARVAREKGLQVIALTGKGGGQLASLADVSVVIPSENTQRIQEGHIAVGHILCDLVEVALFD
ncbi:MAG TPA: D-sedoheptulose 7-phosphate isomerase [Anaerolineae bacterium]|nr:D-sedoheptulose 7-phosphate isomerase [Anaerolineae bacterium]HQJ50241.1 D-sedoheptulose 7-phosphate isomerase [Anaerolineae bacterium]